MGTRRDFLKTAAGAAATLTAMGYTRSAGANDRLSIGLIGCGSRMKGSIMPSINNYAKKYNVEITAVADPWRVAREEAAGICEGWFGKAPQQYVSYRQLLDEAQVDLIAIASPEHLHTTHLKAVAEAKKDVYCEKPLAKELAPLRDAYDAVKANGIVCQVGTQLRSYPAMLGAREYYKTGALGKVGRIEQHRNSARPYWYSYLKEDVREEDVDWAEFLGHCPMRPFDPILFSGWYGFREFSDGAVPSWGAHYIDLVHSITGAGIPKACVAMHTTQIWKDGYGFDCPDHANVVWEYEDGFSAHYSTYFGNGAGNNFLIMGNQGVMDLQDWSNVYVSSQGAFGDSPLSKDRVRIDDVNGPDHIEDWLQCVRERKTPNANIEAGYQHAIAVIMAMRAADTGRRQIYNRASREILDA